MPRQKEFDEAKVLNALKNVFWKNGFDGTSYADLIEASGLYKGSLYGAFGDKRALYLHSLKDYEDHEVESAVALLTGAAATARLSGRDRIKRLLDLVIDAVATHRDRRGCLLCNAAVDQAPHDKSVEKVVTDGLNKMQSAIEAALKVDSPRKDVKEMASQINAVYFGMRVMAKSGAPLSMMKRARDSILKSL